MLRKTFEPAPRAPAMRFVLALAAIALVMAGCASPSSNPAGKGGKDVFASCQDICAQAPASTAATRSAAPTKEAATQAPAPSAGNRLSCPAPCGTEALQGQLWEPQGSLDPRDARHMVIAFRTGDDGGITTMVTTDGGATWTRGKVPVGDGAPEGILRDSNYLGDASLAFLPDGSVVVAGLAGKITEPIPGGPFANTARSVFAARSADGGLTFSEAALLVAGGGDYLATGATENEYLLWDNHDKPWVAAGPGGQVLVTWFAIRDGTASGAFTINSGLQYDLLAALSQDGGRTWSAPITIEADTTWGMTHPAILPDGRMAVALGGGGDQFVYTSSDGSTWEKHAAGRSAGQPILKVDSGPHGPRLLLAYPAIFGDGRRVPVVRASTDGGATWSGGVLLAQDLGEASAHLGMDVGSDGTIIVAWYESEGNGTLAYRAIALPQGGAPTAAVTLASGLQGPARRYGDYLAVAGAAPGQALVGWFAAVGDGEALRVAHLTLS
jgi:hypothetical protein